MTHPVTIENDFAQLEVWPQFGAKITSLVDKSDHFDLLFNYPAENPVEPLEYDRPYAKGWYAGWDECFPAIAASKYAGYPYAGIPVPDHGELGAPPAAATPTRHGTTTLWYGLRFGYRLTRKLSLDAARITCEYTLQNLAPYDSRFVWALYPLMTMTAPVEIDLPDAGPFRL